MATEVGERRIIAGRYVLSKSAPKEGGLSEVYEATDLDEPGRKVAVKILKGSVDDNLARTFFEREAESLRSLSHPHIVSILEAGIDPDLNRYFLVLEWLERDLSEWLRTRSAPLAWPDFYKNLGLPLLEALAHAHERDVVHRDVKPSNVLINQAGQVKLSDFGISKIKSQLTSSPHTVVDFVSRPYAPPDAASSSAFSRDVFAFGVLALRCMSERAITDYPDLGPALRELEMDPALKAVISDCIAIEQPKRRPTNALALFDLIEALERKRSASRTVSGTVFIRLSNTVRTQIEQSLKSRDSLSIRQLLEEEFPEGLHAEMAIGGDDHCFIYGETWSFRAAADDRPFLTLIGAQRPPESRLERMREGGIFLPFRPRFETPINHPAADQVLRLMLQELQVREQEKQADRVRKEQERIFSEWRRQLDAMEGIEKESESPVAFSAVALEGLRATFVTVVDVNRELVGERRVARSEESRGWRGVVESAEGRQLVLYLDHEPTSPLSMHGFLVRDTQASRSAIERQRGALNATRFQNEELLRSELRDFLVDPAVVSQPRRVSPELWLNEGIDAAKQEAVALALGTDDFLVVQGPPGTGKTTFIAELVGQIAKSAEKGRVVLASQTHVALDNALGRLAKVAPETRVVRLGHEADARIAPESHRFLINRQLAEWSENARANSRSFIEDWSSKHDLPMDDIQASLELTQLASLIEETGRLDIEAAELRYLLDRSASMDAEPEDVLTQDELDDVTARLQRLTSQRRHIQQEIKTLRARVSDYLGTSVEEVAATPATGLLELSAGIVGTERPGSKELSALLILQAQWNERVGKGSEFVNALLFESDVVAGTCLGIAGIRAARELTFDLCIIDEASKATATEALVPMVRAQRWVLVGDQRQLPPFVEEALSSPRIRSKFELDENELRRTLFDRLIDGLPPTSKVMLTSQHRMIPAIGDMISNCFYDGALRSERTDQPEDLGLVLPAPVTWFSTSKRRDRFERVSEAEQFGYVNSVEAREIERFLDRLDWLLDQKNVAPPYNVLVLSGYRSQVATLQLRLAGKGFNKIVPEVLTIDSAQGREAEMCVFSVTRSNPRNRLGFLEVSSRINVAMSRGRSALAIFGDAEFCRSAPGPLNEALAYIARGTGTTLVELE